MKKTLCICLLVLSLAISAQEKKDAYQSVMEIFMTAFNAKDYASIHNMFDDNLKNVVPKTVLEQQLSGLYAQAGIIKELSFIEKKGQGQLFKVEHANITFEYAIVLDNNNKISGLRPQPYTNRDVKVIERNTTDMILPFKEEWYVYWGGTDIKQNYHVAYENQKYAYDIMMVKDGASLKGDPKKNESYYVFGKDIIAPCDGKIVQVITGVHDNIPGELNPAQMTGNTVVLETAAKEYILFAHIKQGSVAVIEGQKVKQGDLLGQCGNSGNTTEPHLHLSLQNTISMNGTTGGKLFFKELLVNGEVKKDYLPVQGDKIKNIEN